MKRTIYADWYLALPFLVGCHHAAPESQHAHPVSISTADATALRLTIEPEQSGAPPRGERLRLTLENTSDEWLWLNYGLGLGPRESGSTLWAEVTGVETGSEARWSCARKSLPKGEPRYIELPPSARLSIVLLLACYDFPTQGHVKIVVHFRDLEANPPPPFDTNALWYRGGARSNVLELAVDPSHAAVPVAR